MTRTTSRPFLLLVALSLGILLGHESATATVLRGLENAAWNQVNSWKIEYESEPFPAEAGFSPVHRIVAVAGPQDLYLLNAHFTPTIPWTTDPFSQEIFAHDGTACRRFPFSRSFEENRLNQGDELPKAFSQDVLLAVVPRWPITNYALPPNRVGAKINFASAIASGDYQVLADHETVSGEECVVYNGKGIDRIFLAINKGGCLMRRDLCDPNSHRLVERIVTFKPFQIKPGLWLPEVFEHHLRFGPNGDVLQKSIVRVLGGVIDDVKATTFIPHHLEGSIKFEPDRFTQIIPGGESLLDDIVRFCTRHIHPPPRIPFNDSLYIYLSLGFVGGGLFGYLWQKSNTTIP